MTWIDVVLWVLIAIPFADFGAAVVLVRASRVQPRIQLLYDRARAAVIGTLAAELVALVSLLYQQGIAVPPLWGSLLFIAALLLPGVVPVLFLADYLRGKYNEGAAR